VRTCRRGLPQDGGLQGAPHPRLKLFQSGMARIVVAIYWGAERPSLLRLPVIPPNTE
jgi:hypothetical protein